MESFNHGVPDRESEPGTVDVEGILAQQIKVLQTTANNIHRAHSLVGDRSRLLRKVQSDLAEVQDENRVLRKQLEDVGLGPLTKDRGFRPKSSESEDRLKAWDLSDNVQPFMPGAVGDSGCNVGVDKTLMPAVCDPVAPSTKLLPLLPMEEDATKRTSAEIREDSAKLSEDLQKSPSLMTPPVIPTATVRTKKVSAMSDNSLMSSPEISPRIRASGRPSSRIQFSDAINSLDKSKDKQPQEGTGAPKAVFADAAALKEKLRMDMAKPPYDVKNFYKTKGFAQKVARSHIFENATLTVIGFNALWIMIDTDYNDADILLDADPAFIIMENFFCTYFFLEWLFRYISFLEKRNCLRDTWFLFDSTLVFLMVSETWFMTLLIAFMGGGGGSILGNASILKLVRLLRLSRMARMARLLRAMPELMVLIKGMAVAMRSVIFTLVLLAGIIYIFGIAFVQLLKDTDVGDELFKNVFNAMDTLLLLGVLPDEMGLIEECGKEGAIYKTMALIYILFAGLTVMNMLVGVLCEVVSVVSSVEKESLLVNYVKQTLQHMLTTSGLDENCDKKISKSEFSELLALDGAARAIQDVGVDVVGLMDFTEFIFKGDKALSFPEFMDMILQLRGTNTATVKDIVDLRRYVTNEIDMMDQKICEHMSAEIKRAVSSATSKSFQTFHSTGSLQASQLENFVKNDNDPSMAWAASAASRLCNAASELSVAATELGCRQRLKTPRKITQNPAIEDSS